VILGDIGKNFAAGMSGGIAYIYDADDSLKHRINRGMVDLETIEEEKEADEVKEMIANYFKYTGSKEAEVLLNDWERNRSRFIKVMPVDYKRVLAHMARIKDEQDVTA